MELNSKADEIKAIQKFYNSLPADSYLKSILKGMPEYCERQILDDFGISPLETIDANYKDNTDLRQKIAGMERLKEVQDKELETKAEKIGMLYAKIDEITLKHNTSLITAQDKISELNEAYCNANDKANDLHRQVIELKAKLYDYMSQ